MTRPFSFGRAHKNAPAVGQGADDHCDRRQKVQTCPHAPWHNRAMIAQHIHIASTCMVWLVIVDALSIGW
jgi:hypothetical protein